MVLLVVLVAQMTAAEETKKEEQAKKAEPTEGKELIMLELERVGDSRDKRQTEGEADFASKEVRIARWEKDSVPLKKIEFGEFFSNMRPYKLFCFLKNTNCSY